MNKKVSTLLTVALTLGGSLLSSSAFAETLDGAAKKGGTYRIVRTAINTNEMTGTWTKSTDGTFYLYLDKDGKNLSLTASTEDLDAITWSVKESDGKYILTNGYGKVLTRAEGLMKQTEFISKDYTASLNLGLGEGINAVSIDKDGDKGGNLLNLTTPVDGLFEAGWDFGTGTSTTANLFNLVDASEEVGDDVLNKLFNNRGFNLTAGEDVESNLFEGNGRIYAFDISFESVSKNENKACPEGETVNKNNFIGFKVSNAGVNGKDLIIPAGTYFFTDRVLVKGAVQNSDGTYDAEDIDWKKSTLIVASPDVTVETTVANRDAGQGFKLITAQLDDFIFQENTSEFVVGDTPIWNACFTAKKSTDDKYALRIKNFYYKAKSTDENGTELKKADGGVDLVVLDFTDQTKHLTTQPAGDSFDWTFAMSESGVKDGKELLKTTKEAAVYNIKFISGNKEDEELFGKYLTVGVETKAGEVADGTEFVWVARGTDVANLKFPSYQYTITAAEKENDDAKKYTNVTFTNRETNEHFTVKLFPVEGQANRYTLAFVSKDNTDATISVQPVDVKSNGYGVVKPETAQNPIKIDEDVVIELVPAEVNEFNGFLNVADKSIRTIRFARDKYDTSYQWYTGVVATNNGYSLSDGGDYFVEDIYDAAQFRLNKNDSVSIARTFVYNNGTGEVDDVPNGDKVSAYSYSLEYINDGSATGWYLYDNGIAALGNAEYDFYIKENVDGSVSLFNANESSAFKGMKVVDADVNLSIDAEVSDKGEVSYLKNFFGSDKRAAVYAYVSSDKNLKTYLDSEVPNLSWKAENGHVTLQNNTTGVAGDYISMNDAREGILVDNESNAFYLHATDKDAIVPSFFISKGKGENSNAASERMYMFNPVDSVSYPVNMEYDPNYQLAKQATKVIFKSGKINDDYSQLNTWIKGENRNVAEEADNEGVWGGLNRFKFQIIETADADGLYNIRQVNGGIDADGDVNTKTVYLASNNEKLYFTDNKAFAMAVAVNETEAPTSNESVSASEVAVVAQNGSVVVKNAAGKNVVVSTILGQVVANEVLTSDNATINVPAGIVVVAVEGESFKVNVK